MNSFAMFPQIEEISDMEFFDEIQQMRIDDAKQHQIECDNIMSRIKKNIDECRKILRDGHEIITPEQKKMGEIFERINNFLVSGCTSVDLRNIIELDQALGGESDLLEAHCHISKKWHEMHKNV